MKEEKEIRRILLRTNHISLDIGYKKRVRGELELDDDNELRIVSTQRNLVSNYLYDLLQRGVVYGHKVTVQGDRETRFMIFERFIIEENENHYDVTSTIETLNEHISNDKDKYTYTSQPLHSLAYEYHMNNSDNRN